VSEAPLFRFAQFELPGKLGIGDGRYLVRAPDGDPEAVLVIETVGAPVAARRRSRPRRSEPHPDPAPLPMTRATVIEAAERTAGAKAKDWLAEVKRDHDALDAFVAERLRVLNRTLHAHGTAAMDPYIQELSLEAATAVRAGYGAGEEVADGDWREAIEVPRVEPRRRRADALRPQERVAAVLGGRETIDACETLLLRARLDLDQGRPREAALQLTVGLEALLAEVVPGVGGDEGARDIDSLRERREAVTAAAREAAGGNLDSERIEQVGQTLAICERLLRRRRILGD
jgi:hypothetical protein